MICHPDITLEAVVLTLEPGHTLDGHVHKGEHHAIVDAARPERDGASAHTRLPASQVCALSVDGTTRSITTRYPRKGTILV